MAGLRREWREELETGWEPEFRLVGLLNDDSNPVGAVHLGVVFEVESAGRDLDVRATADTLAVAVAISGSGADGLPNPLEEPGGPDTFDSFQEWGEARVAYLRSIEPKGGIGASGDAAVNGLVSDTRAYIRGPGSVEAARNLTVQAVDTSLFAAASGAVAYGNSAGIAGSVAVNTVKRNTQAFADGATFRTVTVLLPALVNVSSSSVRSTVIWRSIPAAVPSA